MYYILSILIRIPLVLSLPLAAIGILTPTLYLLAVTAYFDERTK